MTLPRYIQLREEFEGETGTHWQNYIGMPYIEYVEWLEKKTSRERKRSIDIEDTLHERNFIVRKI